MILPLAGSAPSMTPETHPVESPAAGARCAEHVSTPAVATCVRCGNFLCAQCYCVNERGDFSCYPCDARTPGLAERGDRFAANLVDHLAIYSPLFLGGFLSGALGKGQAEIFSVLGVLLALGVGGYQVYLAQGGQSIGKRWRGIRVVRLDGSRASLGRIVFLRNFVPASLSSFCGLVGLVDALVIFGQDKRCLHDMIADTKVVKVRGDSERA